MKKYNDNIIIQLENIYTKFDQAAWIHENINIKIPQGKIIALIGGSGSGKSTLLREILGLLKPAKGRIRIFGDSISRLNLSQSKKLRQRMGVLFQQGALFSSLNVLENIIFPLRYFTAINLDAMTELALLKLTLVGLSPDTLYKYPSELSGGMQKRAALARALILDPELLFLDEPSSGLDPVSAASQDELLLDLQQALGLTILMVTHDINTLENITDSIIFLGEKKVLAVESYAALKKNPHPLIQAYFYHKPHRQQA